MLKKTIKTSNITNLKPDSSFRVGCKFQHNNIVYTIKKAYDIGTADQRLLYSAENGEEVVLLSHLLKIEAESSYKLLFEGVVEEQPNKKE